MLPDYIVLGQFDSSKFNLNIKTTTNDVILTKNRFYHIADKHPEVLRFIKRVKKVLSEPDEVYIENYCEDTIWIVKRLKNNVKITLKLNTIKSINSGYKNSVIQMQILENKRIERYLNSKRVTKVFAKQEFV